MPHGRATVAPDAPRARPRAAHQRTEALLLYLWARTRRGVELLVARHQVRRCARSQSKKISRTAPRRSSAMPPIAVAPASVAELDDLLDLPRVVVDPGHQRRDQDARSGCRRG